MKDFNAPPAVKESSICVVPRPNTMKLPLDVARRYVQNLMDKVPGTEKIDVLVCHDTCRVIVDCQTEKARLHLQSALEVSALLMVQNEESVSPHAKEIHS